MKGLMKKLSIAVLVGAMFVVAPLAAFAHDGHGRGGYGRDGYQGHNRGYGNSGYNSRFNYSRYQGRTWHDTSHFDYHPGGFQRHGNHFHFVPGHYDFHRSGHWHR